MTQTARFDVMVKGGGLFGAVAALAVRYAGANVALIEGSWGRTALGSGLFHLATLPGARGERLSLAARLREVCERFPAHPYQRLGLQRTRDAIEHALQLLTPAFEAASLGIGTFRVADDSRHWSVSNLGELTTQALAPNLYRLPGTAKSIGILNVPYERWFAAKHVKEGLVHSARQLGRDASVTLIDIAYTSLPQADSWIGINRAFDMPACANAFVSEVGRSSVARRGFDAVIVPQMLGLKTYGATHARLREAFECDVVEARIIDVPIGGIRLQLVLEASLHQAGIATLTDAISRQTAATWVVPSDSFQGPLPHDILTYEGVALATGMLAGAEALSRL